MKNRLLEKTGITDPDSFDWIGYFERNRQNRRKLKFYDLEPLSRADRATIAPSMRAFAIGEASEGNHLRECAQVYAVKSGWTEYAEIMDRFIREENDHSRLLKAFMASYQIRPSVNSGLDTVFRFLRRRAGIECETAVLVTAEMLALTYYEALARVTNCPLLKDICRQMLHDERYHIVLQSVTLGKLNAGRPEPVREKLRNQRRLLMRATAAAVWDRYDSIFTAAGYSRGRFMASCMRTLEESVQIEKTYQKQEVTGADVLQK